jgi:hypothetical protein
VVVVELLGGTLAAGAGLTVEAWTSNRELSFVEEGLLGSVGETALGRVSSALELGPVEGELVCAFTRVRAANKAAPAQIKVLKRLAINMM